MKRCRTIVESRRRSGYHRLSVPTAAREIRQLKAVRVVALGRCRSRGGLAVLKQRELKLGKLQPRAELELNDRRVLRVPGPMNGSLYRLVVR